MNHHSVTHIDAHMGRSGCVVGTLEKDQVARLCFLWRDIRAMGAQAIGR